MVQAVLQAHGHIPTKGERGAFGYGILTTQGLNAIMVSTTHEGKDSEDRTNAADTRWHNYFVKLVSNPKDCGDDLIGRIYNIPTSRRSGNKQG